jgi:hypothetical protein
MMTYLEVDDDDDDDDDVALKEFLCHTNSTLLMNL